ncbi:MAG: MoaD/ThiS family protein [Bacteroidales bacterium]|nr:MoaD/ThiS family protein [Bacteroidales bacterium]MBN2633701.1 MoaD/ThiS family protein [Bacteroidales bacterium]
MEIKVLFFGVLAEVTETMFRHYRNVESFSDLMLRIRDDYPTIAHYTYRVAVNNELVNDEPQLRDQDEVAFLPPFTGG